MNSRNFWRAMYSAIFVLAVYVAVWALWTRGKLLFVTGLVMALSTLILGMMQGKSDEGTAAPQAEPPKPAAEAPAVQSLWFSLALAAVGFVEVWIAYWGFVNEHWARCAASLAGAAVAWRFCLPFKLPKMSRAMVAALLGLAILTGGAFRFYKGGAVPYGMAMVDEPRLMLKAKEYLGGERQSFAYSESMLADGAIPFYLEALSMKCFGESLGGFRMSGLIIGTFLVLVMFLIGRDEEDAWLGLAAAFLWAVALWPVTVSRAHYLIIETYLMVLLCFLFVQRALKSGGPMVFAVGGIFWGLCFSVYTGAQIMLVLPPWFAFLVWMMRPARRQAVISGLIPLAGGFLIGIAPLLLWAMQDPALAYSKYFASLFAGHTAGATSGAQGIFGILNFVLNRGVHMFPESVKLFAKTGILYHPWYFPAEYPVFDQSVFFLFLVGFSVCLARFRNPFYAFLLFWWIAGLLPAMVADPTSMPNDRRSMMCMPPMLIMAGIGMLVPMDLLTRIFPGRLRVALMMAMALGYAAYLAPQSWKDYFIRNQKNAGLLAWNFYPQVAVARAVYDENRKGPVVVLAGRLEEPSWTSAPVGNPYDLAYWAIDPGLNPRYLDDDPKYFENEGLFGALRTEAQQLAPDGSKPDILVVLTPFYYYLEPFLQRLGGTTVAEIPRVRSNDESPPAPGEPPDYLLKLVRLHNFNPSVLDGLRADGLFQFTAEELQMPPRAHVLMAGAPQWRIDLPSLVQDYSEHPSTWKPVKKVSFSIPDPWFRRPESAVAGGINTPFRIHGSFEVLIPSDGAYAFGANATCSTRLRLDSQEIYRYDQGVGIEEVMHDGLLGKLVQLKAGPHRLDVDQFWLSPVGIIQHSLRVVWQRPGGTMETLPLSVLRPAR